ncbi:MAG: sigma-70 family RNA polymerase sigma factor [Anaerolineae bacterium]|nr:sigma-70 family RNA polymerase sigma factor [Anaerolineae bacterium]
MSHTPSKYPDTPEQNLWIAQAKAGQQAAFGRIVEKYQQPVYNICYHMLKNTDEAEDAAQEVFLRAYTKLDTYDDQRQFSTWLFAIASHYCLDRWKKRRFQLVAWDDLREYLSDRETTQPEKAVLEAEATQEVQDLLQLLQPDYRIVVILKYWHTMSYEEIAQTLDTTISTIKSKLFRARKMLAQAATHKQSASIVPHGIALAGSY